MKKKRVSTHKETRAKRTTTREPKANVDFDAVREAARQIVEKVPAWEAEANELLERMRPERLNLGNLGEAESYLRKHPPSAGAVAFLILQAQAEFAKKGGHGKAARYKAAKEYATDEWKQNRNTYSGKAGFSREIAKRILEKFDLKVTTRQIETIWLKGL